MLAGFENKLSQTEKLYRDLLQEKGYIVQKALFALQKLIERGGDPARAALPEAYQVVESRQGFATVSLFWKECCVVQAGAEVSTRILYEAYLAFCDALDMSAESKTVFSRLFRQITQSRSEEIRVVKRVAGGEQGYQGLTLVQD